MMNATIEIQVEAEAAEVFWKASGADKQKLQALVSLWLREFGAPTKSLRVLMDEISDKARARGMTEAVLDEILRGE